MGRILVSILLTVPSSQELFAHPAATVFISSPDSIRTASASRRSFVPLAFFFMARVVPNKFLVVQGHPFGDRNVDHRSNRNRCRAQEDSGAS